MKDLMNKPVNELTVSDSLKLQGAFLAIGVGIAAVAAGGLVVADKIQTWKNNRKSTKLTLVTE